MAWRSKWNIVFSVLALAGSIFSFLLYVGFGIAVGGVIDLQGHEQDVAVFQNRATLWLVSSVVLFLASGLSFGKFWFAAREHRLDVVELHLGERSHFDGR